MQPVVVVIPCHNEGATISSVISGIEYPVVVVDNLSTDTTAEMARQSGASVVECSIKGAGASTKAGIDRANAHIIVTLDGDGQHNPLQIDRIIDPIREGRADVVIGSRFLRDYSIAWHRKLGIDIITFLYNVGAKVKVTDSQSCFRAFTKSIADDCWIIEKGFGFSTEFLIKARAKGYRIVEVPISCIYNGKSDHSMNAIRHGLQVAWATIKWRLLIDVLHIDNSHK